MTTRRSDSPPDSTSSAGSRPGATSSTGSRPGSTSSPDPRPGSTASPDPRPGPTSSRVATTFASVWTYSKLALGLLLVALLVVFVVQNVNEIHVVFLVWEVDLSQALVVFLALLSGAVLGGTISSWLWWRSSKRLAKG